MTKFPLPYHSSPEERAKRIAERKKHPPNQKNVERFLRAMNGPHPEASTTDESREDTTQKE